MYSRIFFSASAPLSTSPLASFFCERRAGGQWSWPEARPCTRLGRHVDAPADTAGIAGASDRVPQRRKVVEWWIETAAKRVPDASSHASRIRTKVFGTMRTAMTFHDTPHPFLKQQHRYLAHGRRACGVCERCGRYQTSAVMRAAAIATTSWIKPEQPTPKPFRALVGP